MNIIVVALRPEAEPFIQTLRLKRDLSISSHELYHNEEYTLIISGSGTVRSAIATTLALHKCPKPPTTITNIGVAGGPKAISRGALTRAVKIISPTSQTFFPDVTLQTSGMPVTVQTSETPIYSPETWPTQTVADMEASAFFLAAQSFLPLEHIAVWKIISDHYTSEEVTKDSIRHYIEQHTELIREQIECHAESIRSTVQTIFPQEDLRVLQTITETLALTKSQQQILWKQATTFHVRSNRHLPQMKNLHPPIDKREQKQLFQEALYELQ